MHKHRNTVCMHRLAPYLGRDCRTKYLFFQSTESGNGMVRIHCCRLGASIGYLHAVEANTAVHEGIQNVHIELTGT